MWPSSTSASATFSAAHSIIDELADRDRHKKNIIVYNLPEATDHADDKVPFLGLCKTVFNLDVQVTWVTHSGKTLETSTDPYWCVMHITITKQLLYISQEFKFAVSSQPIWKGIHFSQIWTGEACEVG